MIENIPAVLKSKKIRTGIVVSDKMDKTIVVQFERVHQHRKFHKIIRIIKKYKVHDEQEQAGVGDTVEFCEGRPLSKTKFMYLVRIVSSANNNKE